jgi:predicted DsbA family dithiol-disulfide isomerase
MRKQVKPEINVSVISDYICPFCYIGHIRLNRLREYYDLKINWCFVEIHPETSAKGQPVSTLNYSDAYWHTLTSNFHRLAVDEGIQLAKHTITTNSRQALLLAEASKSLGAELFYALHNKLFETCFLAGQNIGDEQVLRYIADACKIPERIIKQAWSDPYTYGPENSVPRSLLPYLQYAGIIKASSVPTFIFNDEVLTGVVDKTTLINAAEKMLAAAG